jgi:hypothetical protein
MGTGNKTDMKTRSRIEDLDMNPHSFAHIIFTKAPKMYN